MKRQGLRPVGQGASTGVIKKHKDGTLETLHSSEKVTPGDSSRSSLGKSLGVTIPGPSGSYTSGRIDVWASLPFDGTQDGAREVSKELDDLLNDLLEESSSEIQKFLETV